MELATRQPNSVWDVVEQSCLLDIFDELSGVRELLTRHIFDNGVGQGRVGQTYCPRVVLKLNAYAKKATITNTQMNTLKVLDL